MCLDEFFEYKVISNIKVVDVPTLTFPAIILCNWRKEWKIEDRIVFCVFNRQDCLSLIIDFEPIIIVGYGMSIEHKCIRFNGQKVSEKNKTALLSVTQNGVYKFGLSIGISIPENVRNKL